MRDPIMWLAMAGLVVLCWCSSAHADRLLPAPVQIGSGSSARCLVVRAKSPLQARKCDAADSTQQWLYGRHTGYALKSNDTGLCLAAERGKLVAGARMVQVRCNASRVVVRWMYNHARTQLRPNRAPLLCLTAPTDGTVVSLTLCELNVTLVPAIQKPTSPLFMKFTDPEVDTGGLLIDSVFGFWGKVSAVISFYKLFVPSQPDPTLKAVKGLAALVSGISSQLARISAQLTTINSRLSVIEGQLQRLSTAGVFLALYPKTLCIRNMAEAVGDLAPLPTDGSAIDPGLLGDYVDYANLIQGGTGISICDANSQENFYNMVQDLGEYMAGVDPTGGGGGGLVMQAFNNYGTTLKNWFQCLSTGASQGGTDCAQQNWSLEDIPAYAIWPLRYVFIQQGKAMSLLAWSKAVLTLAGKRVRFDVDGVYSLRMLRTLSNERSGIYELYSNPEANPAFDVFNQPRTFNDFTPGINLLRYDETSAFTMVSDTVFVDPGIIDTQPGVGVFLKGAVTSKYPNYTPLYTGSLTIFDRRIQAGDLEFDGYATYGGITFADVITKTGANNMVGGIVYSCMDATGKVTGPFNGPNGISGFEEYVGGAGNLPRCPQAQGKDQFTLYLWQDNRFGNAGNNDPTCPIYRFGNVAFSNNNGQFTSGLNSLTAAMNALQSGVLSQPDDAYLTLASAARDPSRRDIIPLGSSNGNLFSTKEGAPQRAAIHVYDVSTGVGQDSLVLTANAQGVAANTKLSDLKTLLGASFDIVFAGDTPQTGEQVVIIPSANNTDNSTVYLDLQSGGSWVLSNIPAIFKVEVEDFKQVLQNNPFCYRPVGIKLTKAGQSTPLSANVYLSLLDAPSQPPTRCPDFNICNPNPKYP